MKTCPAKWLVPLGCAVAGGLIGHFGFLWIARQGFYAIALPGVLIGLAGGWFAQQRSIAFAAVCGVLGLAAGIVSEWRLRPFIIDDSFSYFMTHLHELRPITLILIGLGAVFALWFGLGRRRATSPTAVPNSPTEDVATKK